MSTADNFEPLVSLVAICYNHELYLNNTLDSIKSQTYRNIQLIVIDDASQDNSQKLIYDWIEKNNVECTFITHKSNIGLCKTLNEALTYCTGKYLQLVSCDDILFKDKIEKQVLRFREIQNERTIIVYSDMTTIDSIGNEINKSFFSQFSIDRTKLPRGYAYESILEDNLIPAPSMLIDRYKMQKVGLYDENISFEDLDFILRASKLFEVDFILEPLVYYRLHDSSMSHNITPRYIESHLLIFHKQLINTKDDKHKAIIINQINKYSLISYKLGVYGASRWLKFRTRYEGGWRNYTYYLHSLLGLDFRFAVRTINTMESAFRWFKKLVVAHKF